MPVAFAACECLVTEWIDELDPALVIGIGQAGGRAELSLERVAINLIDARICDSDGNQPIDAPVRAGAPAAEFSSLPLKRILFALALSALLLGERVGRGRLVAAALVAAGVVTLKLG